MEEECKIINKAFVHKRFVPTPFYESWRSTCNNYFDKINVSLDGRAVVDIAMPEERVLDIFNRFTAHYHLYRFEGFKFYWNKHKQSLYLYPNRSHKLWKGITDKHDEYQLMKSGIDELIIFLRKFL